MSRVPGPGIPPAAVCYPDSDGKPAGETEAHIMALAHLVLRLRQRYAACPNVYVIGDMFWYYEEGNPEARKDPDIMVVKGVAPPPPGGRGSFKSWQEHATPCFILELTSEESFEEDTQEKVRLYERLGVREYFLYDPVNECLKPPLMGYRMVAGRYLPVHPADDGSLTSDELGLRFIPAGTTLTLIESLYMR